MMNYKAGIAVLALMLGACATPVQTTPDAPVAEAPPTSEDAAKPVEDGEADIPDCDPEEPDCDHTGTIFRPPDRAQ